MSNLFYSLALLYVTRLFEVLLFNCIVYNVMLVFVKTCINICSAIKPVNIHTIYNLPPVVD